jgi:hypothetical protein
LLEEYVLHFEDWLPGWPKGISEGVIPFLLLIGSFALYMFFIKRKYKASLIERLIALFTVCVVSYIVLSIIGIWFRGEGMVLTLPWNL